MSSGPREQRRYRRLTVRLEVSWQVEDDGEVGRALATTLGAGGLFVPTDQPLPRRTPMRVRFRLPEVGTRHELAAEVVWVNDASVDVPPSGRGMGIAFRDRNAQSRLARELERLPASVARPQD
jgi:Tfp pilus assembly protein PilZ